VILAVANGCDMTVVVTILLAMSVYQIIVSDKLPASSESVPIIGQYTYTSKQKLQSE